MALQYIVDVLRIGSASGAFNLPFDKMPVTSPIISNRRICCSSVNKERTLQTMYCCVRDEEGTSVNKYAFGVKAYAGAYLFLCGGHIGQTNKIISVYSLAFISHSPAAFKHRTGEFHPRKVFKRLECLANFTT